MFAPARTLLAIASLTFPGLVAGCGGASQIAIGAPPAPRTTGTLVGPLCKYDSCTCAAAPGDAGAPEGARKRFEIRLRSTQPLWLSLPGDTVLYKDAERTEACFYVDLAPGQHPIALRASNKDGVSAEMVVREIGAATASFYDTLQFACGNPGVCSFEELAGLKAEFAAIPKGLRDVCGSTKIRGLSWDHGKAPDGTHPSELLVRATLDLYKFAPSKPSGDPTCGPGSAGRGGEVPAPDGTDAGPAVDGDPKADAGSTDGRATEPAGR